MAVHTPQEAVSGLFYSYCLGKPPCLAFLNSHPKHSFCFCVLELCYGLDSRLNFSLDNCYPNTMLNKFLFLSDAPTNCSAALCQLTSERRWGWDYPNQGSGWGYHNHSKTKTDGEQSAARLNIYCRTHIFRPCILLLHWTGRMSDLVLVLNSGSCCFNKIECGSASPRCRIRHMIRHVNFTQWVKLSAP